MHNATKYSLKQFLVIESLLNISNHFTLPLYDSYLRKTDFVAYNADIWQLEILRKLQNLLVDIKQVLLDQGELEMDHS